MGNRLKEIRHVRKINQMEIRLLTGINQTRLSWIENGYVQPRPEEKIKLSRALAVAPNELFPDG